MIHVVFVVFFLARMEYPFDVLDLEIPELSAKFSHITFFIAKIGKTNTLVTFWSNCLDRENDRKLEFNLAFF